MADPKDPKDLNQQAPPDTQARREKDQIAEEDLEKVSGGANTIVSSKSYVPPAST